MLSDIVWLHRSDRYYEHIRKHSVIGYCMWANKKTHWPVCHCVQPNKRLCIVPRRSILGTRVLFTTTFRRSVGRQNVEQCTGLEVDWFTAWTRDCALIDDHLLPIGQSVGQLVSYRSRVQSIILCIMDTPSCRERRQGSLDASKRPALTGPDVQVLIERFSQDSEMPDPSVRQSVRPAGILIVPTTQL